MTSDGVPIKIESLEDLFKIEEAAVAHAAKELARIDTIQRELAGQHFRASSSDGLVTAECNGIGEWVQGWPNHDEDLADEDETPNYDLVDRLAPGWVEAANASREKAKQGAFLRWREEFPLFFEVQR